MHHDDGEGICQFNAVVPVGNAVQTVCHGRIEAQQGCGFLPVDVIGCAGQRTAAQRALVHALCGVVQSAQVTEQHLHVCQQVVCKGHRLRTLQVGVARHHGFGVLFCGAHQCHGKPVYQTPHLGDLIPQVQAQVQRHLIVSGAGGVQTLPHIAVALGQLCLHEHVNILGVGVKLQLAAVQICQNLFQPLNDEAAVLLGNNAAVTQHRGVGNAALNVMTVHPCVKCDGGVEGVHARIDLLGKSSCPKCHIKTSFRSRL